jgi:hypothetical protein
MSMTRDRRRATTTAALGVLLVVGYAVVMVLQILVWNPLAAAPPGLTLDQIHATMQAAGEWRPGAEVWEIGVAALGVALAVALLVAAAVVRRPRPALVALGVAVILAFGAPAYWLASFSMGMSLADTFAISGADASPWAAPLLVASGVAAVVAVALIPAATRAPAERLAEPSLAHVPRS